MEKYTMNSKAKRGRPRASSSQNQIRMELLFGKDDAKNHSSQWSTWSEPYRAIYQRMFSMGVTIVKLEKIKRLREIRDARIALDKEEAEILKSIEQA